MTFVEGVEMATPLLDTVDTALLELLTFAPGPHVEPLKTITCPTDAPPAGSPEIALRLVAKVAVAAFPLVLFVMTDGMALLTCCCVSVA